MHLDTVDTRIAPCPSIPDFASTLKFMSNHSALDQGCLRAKFSLCAYTRDRFHHAYQGPKTCPFCIEIDSIEHRLFYCRISEEIRNQHSEAITWALTQHHFTRCFGILL